MIITIIIIMLITIITDHITTSIFKSACSLSRSFSSNTFPITFISITVSHSNTNTKCQSILLDTPTAPPKFQTLSASPPFRQVFSLPLKTTYYHMSSAKPTMLIPSPNSVSSSSETPQSSQLKFQPVSNIPLLTDCMFLSCHVRISE